MKLLKTTYGHPATIASAYQVKATNWPKLKAGDKDDLRKFAVFVTSLCTAKVENPHLTGVAHQQLWIREVGKCRDYENRPPVLEDFEVFLGQLSRNAK